MGTPGTGLGASGGKETQNNYKYIQNNYKETQIDLKK